MADDAWASRLDAGGNFITKLTGSRVVLMFLAGCVGLILYSAYQNLPAVTQAFTSNLAVQLSAGLGVVFVAAAMLFNAMFRRIEESNMRRFDDQGKYYEARLAGLQAQLDYERSAFTERRTSTLTPEQLKILVELASKANKEPS